MFQLQTIIKKEINVPRTSFLINMELIAVKGSTQRVRLRLTIPAAAKFGFF